MKAVRQGSTGEEVFYLQRLLCERGYVVSVDGLFGPRTYEAVCRFQEDAKLVVDGVVGPNTWHALTGLVQEEAPPDFTKAAQTLNIEVAAIRAVHQVETGGSSGFLPDGRPLILFEGHIFWGQLKKKGIEPTRYQKGNEDILFPSWNAKSYKGGTAEFDRLLRACVINHEAALMSASWGMFQIMGFNYGLCEFDSVYKYAATMHINHKKQLRAFVKFLQKTKLDTLLREHRWEEFAKQYNGPFYKENQYDEKLQAAYLQFSK